MARSLLTSLVLALGVASAVAGHHPDQPRAFGKAHHGAIARAMAPKSERHAYLLENSTLAAKLETRGAGGHATFYHPATEGGSTSACGEQMNDNTMGLALSIPGWKHFASKGLSQKDLCYKSITVHGILGSQKAKLMDECPSTKSTCRDICDVDLTYGLFGMLAEHSLGIFPVSWTFDDGTENPCNDGKDSSGSSHSSSYSSSSHPSSSHSSSSHAASSSSSSQSAPKSAGTGASHSAQGSARFSITPVVWDEIDSQYCPGVKVPNGSPTVAVGPTKQYTGDELKNTCGKWISISSGGKDTKAIVTEWVPDEKENFLAVGKELESLVSSGSVSWQFSASSN